MAATLGAAVDNAAESSSSSATGFLATKAGDSQNNSINQQTNIKNLITTNITSEDVNNVNAVITNINKGDIIINGKMTCTPGQGIVVNQDLINSQIVDAMSSIITNAIKKDIVTSDAINKAAATTTTTSGGVAEAISAVFAGLTSMYAIYAVIVIVVICFIAWLIKRNKKNINAVTTAATTAATAAIANPELAGKAFDAFTKGDHSAALTSGLSMLKGVPGMPKLPAGLPKIPGIPKIPTSLKAAAKFANKVPGGISLFLHTINPAHRML